MLKEIRRYYLDSGNGEMVLHPDGDYVFCDDFDAVVKEKDEFKKQLVIGVQSQLDEAVKYEKRINALKKMLQVYGKHESGCSWRPGLRSAGTGMVCNCGYDHAFKELEQNES